MIFIIALAIGHLNRLSFGIFDCINWRTTKHITLVSVKNTSKFLAFYAQIDCLVKIGNTDLRILILFK